MFTGNIFVDDEENRPLTDSILVEALRAADAINFAKQASGLDALTGEYQLPSGAVVRIMDLHYVQKMLIIPPIVTVSQEEFGEILEQESVSILSCEWWHSPNDYDASGRASEIRSYFSSLGMRHTPSSTTFDDQINYPTAANWTNGSIVLSWFIYASYDFLRPFGGGIGGKELYSAQLSSAEGYLKYIDPITVEAPSYINGACYMENVGLVVSTWTGVYWLNNGVWQLVDGTADLFTTEIYDRAVCVRFSESGKLAVGYRFNLGDVTKIEFELAWDSNFGEVILVSKNREFNDRDAYGPAYTRTKTRYRVTEAAVKEEQTDAEYTGALPSCPSSFAGYSLLDEKWVDKGTGSCGSYYILGNTYETHCGFTVKTRDVTDFLFCKYNFVVVNQGPHTTCDALPDEEPCNQTYNSPCWFAGYSDQQYGAQNYDATWSLEVSNITTQTETTLWESPNDIDLLVAEDFIGEEKVQLYLHMSIDPLSKDERIDIAHSHYHWGSDFIGDANPEGKTNSTTEVEFFKETTSLIIKKDGEELNRLDVETITYTINGLYTKLFGQDYAHNSILEDTYEYNSPLCIDLKNAVFISAYSKLVYREDRTKVVNASPIRDIFETYYPPKIVIKTQDDVIEEGVEEEQDVAEFLGYTWTTSSRDQTAYFSCDRKEETNVLGTYEPGLEKWIPYDEFAGAGVTNPDGSAIFSAELGSAYYWSFGDWYDPDLRGFFSAQGLYDNIEKKIYKVKDLYQLSSGDPNYINLKWNFLSWNEVQGTNIPIATNMMAHAKAIPRAE